MTITKVQAAAAGFASGTNPSQTTGSNVTAGDLLLLQLATKQGVTAYTDPTVTIGGIAQTVSLIYAIPWPETMTSTTHSLYMVICSATGACSIAATVAGGISMMAYSQFHNTVAGVWSCETQTGILNVLAAPPWTSPPLTTVQTNYLHVAAQGQPGSVVAYTYTAGTSPAYAFSYTPISSTTNGQLMLEWREGSAAGTFTAGLTATPTTSQVTRWNVAIFGVGSYGSFPLPEGWPHRPVQNTNYRL